MWSRTAPCCWPTRPKIFSPMKWSAPLTWDYSYSGSAWIGFELSAYRFELLVNLYSKSGNQAVVGIGQSYHRQHFIEHRFCHAFFARRRSMGRDAVIALVAHAYRHVQQLFQQRVKRARSHDA